MKAIQKDFEIKAQSATLEENGLKGAAAVMGNRDKYDDVIFPGFFTPVLAQFLETGFVTVGHQYRALPVAMPKLAEERGNLLYTEAVFHSTESARDARTICRERLEQNLSMGLSVGFWPDYDDDHGVIWFENGRKLVTYAEANGYDLRLFDVAGICACEDYMRGLIKCRELIEYAITPAPANPLATITDAKDYDPDFLTKLTDERAIERILRDAGFSRRDAKVLLSQYKAVLQRDAAEPPTETTDPAPEPNPAPAEASDGADALRQRCRVLRAFALQQWAAQLETAR